MKMIRFILALLILPICLANSRGPESAHPALWKVSSRTASIYLFGTVHALPHGLRWHTQQYQCGWLSRGALQTRWHSWRGHAEQADTGALVERIRKELREILGATGN